MIHRVQRRLTGSQNRTIKFPDYTAEKKSFQTDFDTFKSQAATLNRPELEYYYWYHTVDIGDGIVTPGDFDYRKLLPTFHFPQDMRGMHVLDVGSATGFFAFEFEKRGAEVVTVELPSLSDWDIISTEKPHVLQDLQSFHHVTTPEDAYERHLRGPFQFCADRLGSKVKRCFSSVYELTPEKLGRSSFDLVFMGDILLHLFAPLKALDVVAPFCSGTLVVTTKLVETVEARPYLAFLGNTSKDGNSRTWWAFNNESMESMLKRVGFQTVDKVSTYSTVMRRVWVPFSRTVFHAQRS